MWRVRGRRERTIEKHQKLSSKPSVWWMYPSDGNYFSYHSPRTSFLFSPLKPPLDSHVVIMWESEYWELFLCLFLTHFFFLCVSLQHVTPASVELRVVVCSQRAWGWRRLRTSRFTPKEPALESSKSPSRGQVSYTVPRLLYSCSIYNPSIIQHFK